MTESDKKLGEYCRTLTTWGDLGAVKEALVEKDLWEEFIEFAFEQGTDEDEMGRVTDADFGIDNYYDADFIAWLFRPVNENGEPHFCQLVTDWLKERKA